MKIGIIILFRNSEKVIDKDFLIKYSRKIKRIELCFVNNESKDSTYNLLKEVKEECDNVSIVNIKKYKSDSAAVRAGARFMFNQFKLDHLGYLNIKNLKTNSFIRTLNVIKNKSDQIVDLNIKKIQKSKIKFTLFQKLFSVIDYINKLELENTLKNSHT